MTKEFYRDALRPLRALVKCEGHPNGLVTVYSDTGKMLNGVKPGEKHTSFPVLGSAMPMCKVLHLSMKSTISRTGNPFHPTAQSR